MSQMRIVVILLVGLAGVAGPGGADHIPELNEDVKLLASDGATDDNFGGRVDLDGDTLVVGAEFNDDFGFQTGAAYVFERTEGGVWVETAKLLAADSEAGDAFGWGVAVDGNTIVVGARGDDDLGEISGAAYIFERIEDGIWIETAKLLASDGSALDFFGAGVAIDGDTVVVGAEAQDDFGFLSGAAYVFERGEDGTWVETARLQAHDATARDSFGEGVSISGDRIAVSARGDNDFTGAAYLFERQEGGSWIEVVKILASDGEPHEIFGIPLDLDGDILAVGATGDSDQDVGAGAAFVFERTEEGDWEETAKLFSSHPAFLHSFGRVAIDGETIVAGATGFVSSGTADLFRRSPSGEWIHATELLASDGVDQDLFGIQSAIDGDTIIVGARYDDDLGPDSGSAYVFSIKNCNLAIQLDSATVPAGEQLRIALSLEHNRPETVTVPFRLWIEDEGGTVIASQTTPPMTFHHEDTLRQDVRLRIPEGTPPGRYVILVGLDRMQQGIASAVQPFRVAGPSAPALSH